MGLAVYQRIHRSDVFAEEFRIVETFDTVDGTRTRMTHRVFNNKDEALDFCENPSPEFKEP